MRDSYEITCSPAVFGIFSKQTDPLTGLAVPSPLVDLKYFGMVSCVPCESMHTLYQLVCKNFFESVIIKRYLDQSVKEEGKQLMPKAPAIRNETGEVVTFRSILDSRIAMCQKLCPDEFQRNVSTTVWISTWKATEHRTFWLYMAYPLMEDLLGPRNPHAVQQQILKMIRFVLHITNVLC